MPISGVGNESRLFDALFAQDAARRQEENLARSRAFQMLGLGRDVLGTSLAFTDRRLRAQQDAEEAERQRGFKAGESALERSARATEGGAERRAAMDRLLRSERGATTRAQARETGETSRAQLRETGLDTRQGRELGARRSLSEDERRAALELAREQDAAAFNRALLGEQGAGERLDTQLESELQRLIRQFEVEEEQTAITPESLRNEIILEMIQRNILPGEAPALLESMLRMLNPEPFTGPLPEQAIPPERTQLDRAAERILRRLPAVR